MSKTISTTGDPPDIDGTTVTANESLKQRIRCAFRYRLTEWFLRTDEGIDYDLIFKHNISRAQVAQILVRIIEEEGAGEITSITDVIYDFDNTTRNFVFSCKVQTIHGLLDVRETIS